MHKTARACLLALALAGCSFPTTGGSPPPDPATLAAATVAAVQTEVGERLSLTVQPTIAPSPAATATSPEPSASPPSSCSDRATLVDDVTIRDNTPLAPGEVFVKIWRLRNSGTCTWTTAYALAFFGGERMQAPGSIPLAGPVPPGAMVDLSADMTAPMEPGTHQGFWRLRNADGEYFGLGASGDQSFWVRIVVRPVLTATVSPTPPPTPSPTPAILVSAALDLAPGNALDLDSGRLDPDAGADLVFGPLGPSGAALLPQGPAVISFYSPPPDPPRPIDCLSAPLRPEPIPAALLAPGSIACFLTGQSHPGYLVVVSVGETISLAFTTWVP